MENKNKRHHLIFEGPELAGKSWVMSQIYEYLEPKYNEAGNVFDGCHWFNSDNGVFGTKNSRGVIEGYLNIFESLRDKNIIVEKFSMSDKIYQKIHNGVEVDYSDIEKKLKDLNFKVVLITFPEDVEILKKRIEDRLNLYPHYEQILQKVDWYIDQQKEYKKEIEKLGLPYKIIETNVLPDEGLIKEIIEWIEE